MSIVPRYYFLGIVYSFLLLCSRMLVFSFTYYNMLTSSYKTDDVHCFGGLLFFLTTPNVQSADIGRFDLDERGASRIHGFALSREAHRVRGVHVICYRWCGRQ